MATIISIYGIKPNIGATHLAISLTRVFQSMEYKAAYLGDSWQKAKDCGAETVSENEADSKLEEYDYIIKDRGTRGDLYSDHEIRIVITGIKPTEKTAEEKFRKTPAANGALFVYAHLPENEKDGKFRVPYFEKNTPPEKIIEMPEVQEFMEEALHQMEDRS